MAKLVQYNLHWKNWLAQLRNNVVMFLLLSIGLALYLFYTTWTSTVASPLKIREVIPTSDVAVVFPSWVAYTREPDFSRMLPLAGGYRDKRVLGYRFPAETPWGKEQIVGMLTDPSTHALAWSGVDLMRGRLPTGPGEAVAAQQTNVAVGDEINVTYREPFTSRVRTETLAIVGTFRTQDPLMKGLLMTGEGAHQLSSLPAPNIGLVWIRDDLPPGWTVGRIIDEIQKGLRTTRVPAIAPPKSKDGIEETTTQTFLPFAFSVKPLLFHKGTSRMIIQETLADYMAAVSLAIGAVFLLLVLTITVLVVVQVVESQRASGIYLVQGFEPSQIGGFYRLQAAFNFALSLPAGIIIAVMTHVLLAMPFSFADWTGALALWVLFAIAVAFWAGKASALLISSSEPIDQLKQVSRYDWWALIRFFQ